MEGEFLWTSAVGMRSRGGANQVGWKGGAGAWRNLEFEVGKQKDKAMVVYYFLRGMPHAGAEVDRTWEMEEIAFQPLMKYGIIIILLTEAIEPSGPMQQDMFATIASAKVAV